MPYDLFVTTTQAPAEEQLEHSATTWEWVGSWPCLGDAQAHRIRLTSAPARYTRWRIFSSRRRTSARGALYQAGDYVR